jgi:signal transduction histidine kinase
VAKTRNGRGTKQGAGRSRASPRTPLRASAGTRPLREQLASVPDPLALLEGLFTHSPVPYAVFTADGHCLLINPAYRRMFGAEPPPEYDLFRDELLEGLGFLAYFRRAFAGETVQTPVFWYDVRELEHIDVPQANRIAISCHCFPLAPSGTDVTHIAIAYKDMTAELAARESERAERERLRQLFSQAPVAINVLRGPELRYEFANPLQHQLMGGRELVGRTLREAIPDMSPDVLALHHGVLETGERAIANEYPVTLDYAGGGRSETKFWNIIYEPLRDERGRPDGLVTFAFEVTEQVLARQAVESQQMWLEAVLDLMPMPVVMVDPRSGELTFSNAAADRLNGRLLPKHVPASKYAEVLHVTDMEGRRLTEAEMPTVRAARGEKLEGLEIIWNTEAGQRFVSVSSELLPAMHGHPASVVMPFQDITRLKTVERHLQEAIRARDEFLSVASHELKTPLTSLGLRLHALARAIDADPESAVSRRHGREVAAMKRQVSRLAELIDGLLDVSRISTGRLRIHREPVDLAALVQEMVARFVPEAERAGCTLDLRPSGPCEGSWDRLRMEQVVSNLLSNALKYGAGQPVHVHVEAEGGLARLWVRDEGIGIDAAAHARIFQKFERAVSERHYGGLGLGLYVVRTLVEAMGGTIRVESQPGEGATFIVELPLQPAEAPVQALQSASS